MLVFYSSIDGKIYGQAGESTAEVFASNFPDCVYEVCDSPLFQSKEIINYKYDLITHSLVLK